MEQASRRVPSGKPLMPVVSGFDGKTAKHRKGYKSGTCGWKMSM
jgi:hypothetical protein